jgi:hypothetical protein
MHVILFIPVLILTFFLGCSHEVEKRVAAPVTDVPSTTTTDTTTTTTVKKTARLSWENSPNRAEWTRFVLNEIESHHFPKLDKATDATRFCSNYKTMASDEKIRMWGEVVAWIAFYESAWKPTTRMVESQKVFKKPDPVTGQPVASEGLMQLSYQDVRSYPFCNQFDWSKDKHLSKDDPKKTIFDPLKNLDCAMKILAQQVERRGQVILQSTKGLYWAVLYEGGKYDKTKQVISNVKKAMGCK